MLLISTAEPEAHENQRFWSMRPRNMAPNGNENGAVGRASPLAQNLIRASPLAILGQFQVRAALYFLQYA